MKITIIGGGSYSWAFGFVRQFIDSEVLKGSMIHLMDINSEALHLVHQAVDIYNSKKSKTVTIESSTDLNRALEEADFVIVAISTGGLAAMKPDLEIPEKYGIWHTVGDTVGPGGWSRAIRNIPVFYDLGKRMKQLCPDAWFINVTNPLTVLTRVVQREFGIKSIGMCPGVEEATRTLLKLVNLPSSARLDFTVTGIDHGSWFTRLYADGIDILQRLKDLGYYRNDDHLPSKVVTDDPMAEAAKSRAIFAIWKEIGYLPSIADRHAVENFPWFLVNESGQLPFQIKRTFIHERQDRMNRRHRKLEEYVQSKDENVFGDLGHGDDPVREVIESLCGFRSFLWTSNYMNVGQIPSLPEGAVVETRCLFNQAGVHPLCSPMPDILNALVLPHVSRQEAIIDIALKGSFDELAALVSTDPMCCRLPIGKCRDMMQAMVSANSSYIQNQRLHTF